ncbi:hypothetical protein NKJ35_22285 [Mesorhizobium sp. M0136]|uniref:hypothetical protein n=1 Tax=Mesorhizobium sp. M0136 TaxID=2956890 RepID=UPI003339126B
MTAVVASDRLERSPVWAEDDPSVKWAGAFAVYGGHGTTQSPVIVYEIEPGKRLGWHSDATEETRSLRRRCSCRHSTASCCRRKSHVLGTPNRAG